jgi:hypothetical protein
MEHYFYWNHKCWIQCPLSAQITNSAIFKINFNMERPVWGCSGSRQFFYFLILLFTSLYVSASSAVTRRIRKYKIVAIDGTPRQVVVTDATGCNPQKFNMAVSTVQTRQAIIILRNLTLTTNSNAHFHACLLNWVNLLNTQIQQQFWLEAKY